MLLSYLRLVLFAAGLLIGVQVPGFINDYAKRVEAHLIEAQTGLSGFQNTANQFFKGDMQALVAHYRASEDPVFRSDADSLGTLLTRQVALDKQFQAMQGPVVHPLPASGAGRRSRIFARKPGMATATRSC